MAMKCDFHVHTRYSYDSISLPREVVDVAIQKGIGCLAITDHEETKGAIKAAEYAFGKSVLIIPGVEVKSREGDILGLNVKKAIQAGLSARETIKKIKEQGGMAIIPHPFAIVYPFKGDLKDFLREIDGIEVLNAALFNSENKKAMDLARENNLCFTAGSDAHFPNLIGKAYLEIPGENLSIEQVLKAVIDKNAEVKGKGTFFFERILNHTKRNIAKFNYYVRRKKKKL